MRWFSFAAAMLLSAAAVAAPPVAAITGSSAGIPGDLIELDASGSTGDRYLWQVKGRADTQRVSFKVLDDGKRLIVASYPGTYDIQLIVANLDGIATADWTVQILPLQPDGRPLPKPPGPTPDPGPAPPVPPVPNPLPTPTPTPVPPPAPTPTPVPPPTPPAPPAPVPTPYGLRANVRQWAAAVGDRDGQKKMIDAFKPISNSLRDQAAAIAAGTQAKPNARSFPNDVVNRLAAANKAALGLGALRWSGFWQTQVGPHVQNLLSNGTLDGGSPAAWADVIDELISGLE